MIVGIPRETKPGERRVAITPAGVNAFVLKGHRVLIERGAGFGSGIPDAAYAKAGATIVSQSAQVWGEAEMVMKVKEPLPAEIALIRKNQIVFTYLHLAASKQLTLDLIKTGCIAVGYETVQLANGSLPLLVPMSEVAGRLSVQAGAQCLEAVNGGKGILLSGVSGVRPAEVMILGAGVAGSNACLIAYGNGAHVSVFDVNPAKLSYVHDIMHGHITTVMSNAANIEEEIPKADLVICTVLVPGDRTPTLISRELLRRLEPGSAIVDISIDQGGCCETARPTTHDAPTFVEEGIVHYCVSNMPGAVPKTSTFALTNATLSYGLEIANKGIRAAAENNPALMKGVNLSHGEVINSTVAAVHGLPAGSF